jgi:pSer/pThr/pTyr-binding forkhead associated (FHA) protein
MTDDRTTPMRQPEWPQNDRDSDEQETVYADQGQVTPPTIPLGDQGTPEVGQQPDPGFVRSTPQAGITPRPSQQPQPPFGSQPPQESDAPAEQTMLISEQPIPVFAWLVVVDGPARGEIGRVHVLQPHTTTIGRVQGNDIVLHDETSSAQHARIRLEEHEDAESALVLYDMGSRNGTFVGDQESYRDEENRQYRHELEDGDYMLVGETTLVFKKI